MIIKKRKYGERASIETVYIKTDAIYKHIVEDVETRFDTSNYEVDRTLPKGKNKKGIGLMKDELGRKIMIKFVRLRTKTYSYLIGNGSEDKESRRHTVEANQLANKISDLEKILT